MFTLWDVFMRSDLMDLIEARCLVIGWSYNEIGALVEELRHEVELMRQPTFMDMVIVSP